MTDKQEFEILESEYLNFLEEVRQRSLKIMARCVSNSPQSVRRAREMAEDLAQIAVSIRRCHEEERTAIDSLDQAQRKTAKQVRANSVNTRGE